MSTIWDQIKQSFSYAKLIKILLEIKLQLELILFFLCCRRIVYNDLSAIAPEQYFKQITNRLAEIKAVSVCWYIYLLVRWNQEMSVIGMGFFCWKCFYFNC